MWWVTTSRLMIFVGVCDGLLQAYSKTFVYMWLVDGFLHLWKIYLWAIMVVLVLSYDLFVNDCWLHSLEFISWLCIQDMNILLKLFEYNLYAVE